MLAMVIILLQNIETTFCSVETSFLATVRMAALSRWKIFFLCYQLAMQNNFTKTISLKKSRHDQ